MKNPSVQVFKSIAQYHATYGLSQPVHPLISVLNYSEFKQLDSNMPITVSYDFYVINLKKNFEGKVKYGQQYYDFDNGVMTFYAPKQVLTFEVTGSIPEGWTVIIHPDLLHGSPLAAKIRDYGFFSYATNEALHLSKKEETIIEGILDNLRTEISLNTDLHTQNLILSHIDLFLNYCSRFYSRQFITRKKVSNDLLAKFEHLLNEYFKEDKPDFGLPSVQYFADQLLVSKHYLNDMLKSHTGLTSQQHIQNHLIELAKQMLSTSTRSVSEIAYLLGFEHSQSFNKFFKNKVNLTPTEFKQSFN